LSYPTGFDAHDAATSELRERLDAALERSAGLRAQLSLAKERIEKLEAALRSLRNEASGFVEMADPSAHGWTNIKCLLEKIEAARAALANPPPTTETKP
jgi:multidrug resistance efflux pump